VSTVATILALLLPSRSPRALEATYLLIGGIGIGAVPIPVTDIGGIGIGAVPIPVTDIGGIGIGAVPIPVTDIGGIGIGAVPIPVTLLRIELPLKTTNNANTNANEKFFTASSQLVSETAIWGESLQL